MILPRSQVWLEKNGGHSQQRELLEQSPGGGSEHNTLAGTKALLGKLKEAKDQPNATHEQT